jgi:hypothetical protein
VPTLDENTRRNVDISDGSDPSNCTV